MPTDIKLVHEQDLVRATSAGELDLETSKKLLIEIISAADHLADYAILLDTRKAHVKMSATDLWYLAAELSDFRKGFSRKTAVLCPVKRFDDAVFFALCSENRGIRIRAFTSFGDAVNWLLEMEPNV